ncbi:hypothetical protein Sru01_08110 [Sphaerisporangium rufum]|uniref:Peptidase inhibitor family I36 n=1 Tax=Sphaerisporangium rufum TaxID=1381558 RepID=A0A919QXC8_9ACTN|nr:hypothetical protein [Sphaerisporangium rufum]GII75829.1 hypothetical protein Sru01_08110 [Sphaerisporangium rufum]
MKQARSLLTAAGLAALALLTVPVPAHADPSTPPSADASIARDADGASAALAADGYFYAWMDIKRGGFHCGWAVDDANWEGCGGFYSMRNEASSLENRGYAGAYEDVILYWDNADDAGGWDGTRTCLPRGLYLDNLKGIYYPWDGRSGQGQSLNDNISAHRWGSGC